MAEESKDTLKSSEFAGTIPDADRDTGFANFRAKIERLWVELETCVNEIGMDPKEKQQTMEKFEKNVSLAMGDIVKGIDAEKESLVKECVSLQLDIFKMLRVFSTNGYKPNLRRLEDKISEETYTEINQIFTKEAEFNEIMKVIPDKYTKEYLLRKISPPYNETRAYLLLVGKLLAKEYFSRLFKFLETVLLLKELAYEIEFYSEESLSSNQVDESSVAFYKSLPSVEECKGCLLQLEKVPDTEDNIDTIFKVVCKLLNANRFNNLSKTFLSRIENQIELVEIERNNVMEKAIVCANNIVELWKVLYNYDDSEEAQQSDQFDINIIKCSEGGTAEIGLRPDAIEYLQRTFDALVAEKATRTQKVKQCCQTLKSILEVLKEPKDSIDEYMAQFDDGDVSSARVKFLEDKIAILQEKKKRLMKDIVECTKDDILKTWNKLYFDPEGISLVDYFETNDFSDEAFSSLQSSLDEIEGLSKKYEDMFTIIENFESLLTRKRALDEASRNPSRLMSRNSSAILLEEERARRDIKRRYPKACHEAYSQLSSFNEETQQYPKTKEFNVFLEQVIEELEGLEGRKVRSRLSPERNTRPEKSPAKKVSPVRKASPVKKSSPLKLSKLPNNAQHSPQRAQSSGAKPKEAYPKLRMTKNSNLQPRTKHSVNYSVPLHSFKVCKPVKSRINEPDNIFYMASNKENNVPIAEEVEASNSLLVVSQEDSVYRDWKMKRLRNIKSSLSNVLPDEM